MGPGSQRFTRLTVERRATAAAPPAQTPTSGPGVQVWSGARPMTPDGLPVIGWIPGYQNLAVASGHAMLGLTLAPATGEAIAELMTSGHLPESAAPFDPARFA